jgi:hypothetical protein
LRAAGENTGKYGGVNQAMLGTEGSRKYLESVADWFGAPPAEARLGAYAVVPHSISDLTVSGQFVGIHARATVGYGPPGTEPASAGQHPSARSDAAELEAV